MFCCEDFFVNGFRFKINNGRWSDTSAIKIPETNLSGGSVNILSIYQSCSILLFETVW